MAPKNKEHIRQKKGKENVKVYTSNHHFFLIYINKVLCTHWIILGKNLEILTTGRK